MDVYAHPGVLIAGGYDEKVIVAAAAVVVLVVGGLGLAQLGQGSHGSKPTISKSTQSSKKASSDHSSSTSSQQSSSNSSSASQENSQAADSDTSTSSATSTTPPANTPVLINSNDQAVDYLKQQLGYQNNSDISAGASLIHDAAGNYYVIQLRSISSVAENGAAGTIGYYKVYPNGNWQRVN